MNQPETSPPIQVCIVPRNGVTWLRIWDPDVEEPILIGLPVYFLGLLQEALTAVGNGTAAHAHLFIPKTRPVRVNTYDPNLN